MRDIILWNGLKDYKTFIIKNDYWGLEGGRGEGGGGAHF